MRVNCPDFRIKYLKYGMNADGLGTIAAE